MMLYSKYIIGIGLLLVVVAGGWFLSSQEAKQVHAVPMESAEADVTGPLDGMTFSGVIGSPKQPARSKDKFVFSQGKFISTECVKSCGYHAGPYFIRERDGKTEFLSVSHCTYKDA